MIPFKISHLRVNSSDRGPKATYDVDFGVELKGTFVPLFKVKDFALFTSNSGEFFSRGPTKVITDKSGQPVKKQGTNYPMRIEFWQPIWEGEDNSRAISSRSGDYRDSITAAAVDMYNQERDKPQAAPAPRRNAAPAKVAAAITSTRKGGTPVASNEDDDLPF